MRYIVSPKANRTRLSGMPGERLFKTKAGAVARVKKVKKITGKKYYISKID